MPDALDLAALRAVAEAATPGSWRWSNSAQVYLMGARSKVVMAFRRRGMQDAQPQFPRSADDLYLEDAGDRNLYDLPNARHIATFDPPTVLALLDEVERLSAPEHAVRVTHDLAAATSMTVHEAQQALGVVREAVTARAERDAAVARAEAAEAQVKRANELAAFWDRRADESEAMGATSEDVEDRDVLDRLTRHRRMFAHALRAALDGGDPDAD